MTVNARIKRQLGQMYCTPEREAELSDMQEQALAFLAKYDPVVDESSLESDPWVRELCKNYMMYADSRATDDFQINYRAELISLTDRGRKRAEAERQSGAGDSI